jgi:hypothetical protein
VEEGLAPDGAAPSPSGVPDGWGDGDREMEMEMGMQMERGMEMGLGMEMETEMEIEMVMEMEMEKEMGMEMALVAMEMEIMDALPPPPPSPHVVVDVPNPNPTSPIAPSSTTHQAGYPGGVWVALTHGAAWRRGAHPHPTQPNHPPHLGSQCPHTRWSPGESFGSSRTAAKACPWRTSSVVWVVAGNGRDNQHHCKRATLRRKSCAAAVPWGHRARDSGQQLPTGNGQRHTPAVTLVAVWGAAYQCCTLTQL